MHLRLLDLSIRGDSDISYHVAYRRVKRLAKSTRQCDKQDFHTHTQRQVQVQVVLERTYIDAVCAGVLSVMVMGSSLWNLLALVGYMFSRLELWSNLLCERSSLR